MKVLGKTLKLAKGYVTKLNVKKVIKIGMAVSGVAVAAFMFFRPDENYEKVEKDENIKEGVDE